MNTRSNHFSLTTKLGMFLWVASFMFPVDAAHSQTGYKFDAGYGVGIAGAKHRIGRR